MRMAAFVSKLTEDIKEKVGLHNAIHYVRPCFGFRALRPCRNGQPPHKPLQAGSGAHSNP